MDIENVVLFARRSAGERNRIARSFGGERNKIARSFGGERNKITRSFRLKGIRLLVEAKGREKTSPIWLIASSSR